MKILKSRYFEMSRPAGKAAIGLAIVVIQFVSLGDVWGQPSSVKADMGEDSVMQKTGTDDFEKLRATPKTPDNTGNETIYRTAGNYAMANPILAIPVFRGTSNREVHDKFRDALSTKLTEAGIPHKFFIEDIDEPGTVYSYIIKTDKSGPFNANQAVAILPSIVGDYRVAYPQQTPKSGF